MGFFERLPAWVMVPLILGGALLTYFSSHLPDWLQTAGAYLGVAFIIAGFIGIALHWLKERRGAETMGPTDLIILGAGGAALFVFVLAGGLIWQAVQSSRVPKSPSIPSSTSAPPAHPSPPIRVYSADEKEDLRNAMRELSKILDSQGNGLVSDINETEAAWSKFFNSRGSLEVAAFKAEIKKTQEDAATFRNSLRDYAGSMSAYRSYADEIDAVLQLPQPSTGGPNWWQKNPIESLRVSLSHFDANITIIDRVMAHKDPQLLQSVLQLEIGLQDLQTKQLNFTNWMAQTKTRIASLRASLR